MTSAAIGITSAEDALGGDVGEGPLGGVVDGVGEQPEQQRAGARQRARPPTASAGGTTAACSATMATNRDRGRRPVDVGRRSSHQLPEQALQRVVEGAHLEQPDRRVAGEPRQRGGQLAGLHGLDRRGRRASRRTSRRPTESRPTSAAASRRPSSARTSTCRGRSSIASRIARWPPAAASRPWMSTITRSASRSTSLSTCELTITVRPSAPSRLNRAIRCTRCTGSAPFSGSSSTSTCGSVTSAAATLRALAHALAEAVDAPVGDVEQPDRRAAPRRARRGRRRRGGRRRSARTGGR